MKNSIKVRHFKEQLFTGYDVTEFEKLFQEKPLERIATTGVDGWRSPSKNTRTSPCQTKRLNLFPNGTWRFPKSESY